MIKGFYAAVSAMVMNASRQQLLAHNVSNLQTPGFKQVLNSVQDFQNNPVLYSPGNLLGSRSLATIGEVGLGTVFGPESIDFTQGGLMTTGHPFDLAIQGEGFFSVQTPDGVRYTRDGRFIRDAQNQLVTVDGYRVLNSGGQPIQIPDGVVSFELDGRIKVNGAEIGQLGLVRFESPEDELERDQGNLFSAAGQPTGEGEVRIVQGGLEMSNANPTQLMTQLVEVARSYEAAMKMVQNQDELLGKTIASLGRIG